MTQSPTAHTATLIAAGIAAGKLAPTYPMVYAIVQRGIERFISQGVRGKLRDKAAIEFMCGAVSTADVSGQKDLTSHLMGVAFMVSVRGYSEMANFKSPEAALADEAIKAAAAA